MKIVRLTAENVKRINAVEITPTGDMVVIGGANGQGKTSCLDAIAMALGGGDAACDQPLKAGTVRGKTVVELDDLVVTRKYTPSGTALEVTSREGQKFPSPQAVLDALVGKLTFDPLAFARMKPKEQLEMIRQMTGLNFTLLDSRRQALFDQRTAVNREVKAAEGQVAGMKSVPGLPEEEISVAELTKQIEVANAKNTANAEARAALNTLREAGEEKNAQIADAKSEVARLRKQMEAAEARVEALQDSRDALRDQYAAASKNVDALADTDTAPLIASIQTAEEANRQVRANRAYAEARHKLQAKQRESADLTAAIEEIDRKKQDRLAATKFPVEGLSLTDDTVLFEGIPFSQASAAQQLRVSVAIGMAANPKLRVLLCRDGSLLDDRSLGLLAEIVKENDFQCWIERVGAGEEVSVVISDGYVEEAR